tara:strand:+ start:16195 stop:17616 length:1422 start_codon:yes stop_codon:yes gene_type:complete
MNKFQNRTKIVATIGPKVSDRKNLIKLYKAGMNIARLNGSHNNLAWHEKTIKNLKDYLPDVPILFDIPGKKIRTCNLINEPEFKKNDIIILTTNISYKGNQKVPINNTKLHLLLKPNDKFFADDGTLAFKVKKIIKKDIYCYALNDGKLKNSKGINVPHINLGIDKLSKKEISYINFAVKNSVNFIGVSFVESKTYIKEIRNIIKQDKLKIIAKIENQGGLNNMQSIIKHSDGIMIDRGDLSIETNIESIAINQKEIIKTCQMLSKPVIVATEMLDSMILKPFPTKAEIVDISNAVLDGASCVMLSGETAVGNFPTEAIKIMSKVSKKIEENNNINKDKFSQDIPKAIGHSIAMLCEVLPITKVIAITISGFAARALSAQNIKQPILAISNDYFNAKGFNLYRGTTGIYVKVPFKKNSLAHVSQCLKILWEKSLINSKDVILVTAVGYPNTGNRMNLIQTHNVKDLKNTFKWK